MLIYRNSSRRELAITLAWAFGRQRLQFAVQLPVVLRLMPNCGLSGTRDSTHVREILRNFVPVFVSRGVVQISAYVDLGGWPSLGARRAWRLTNAQTIYMLPVSLFGMAVSAAELPAMSSTLGSDGEIAADLRRRLNAGLRQIAILYCALGDGVPRVGRRDPAALYQCGKFTHEHSVYVWEHRRGLGVGLLASTLGRLYSSTYYALRDTRTPLRFAIVRVVLTTVLGIAAAALLLPRWLHFDPKFGAVGLTASPGSPDGLSSRCSGAV